MKTFFLLLSLAACFCLPPCGVYAASPAATGAADSLLDALDRAIARYPHSVERREARIAALKRQVAEADTASMEYFRLNEAVYNEYRVFVCDSAGINSRFMITTLISLLLNMKDTTTLTVSKHI